MSDPLNPRDRVRPKALRLQSRLMPIIERHQQVAEPVSGEAPIGWLLPFKPLLREFSSPDDPWRRLELAYLLRDGDPRLGPLLVWLLGHCASRFKLCGIENYRLDTDPAMRKQVAKALRRLGAATPLREMAEAWPHDAWVQRFSKGAAEPPPPFTERLSHFVSHNVDDSHASEAATPSRMSYWARDVRWYLTPPKNAGYIRRLLLRIQRWVHG